jgi:drug/metabolite transporter (DMT)-like permease
MAPKRKLTENQMAAIIGVVGGVMMILVGASGAAAWAQVVDFLQRKLGTDAVVQALAYILILIASMGGLAVMLGSTLFLTRHVRAGRLLIALGAGFGLIGLIVFIFVRLEHEEFSIAGIGLGMVGLVLSIIARLKSKVQDERR